MILGIFLLACIGVGVLGAWNGTTEYNKGIQKLVEEDNKKNKS